MGAAELERLGEAPPHEAAAVAATGLVGAYKELQVQVQAALPQAFAQIPKLDLEIQGTDWLPRPAASLYYQAGPPGAGILLVSTGRGGQAPSVARFLPLRSPGYPFSIAP